jgi:glycosyltransferase involved in cell wall biosynthesis
MGLHDAHLIPPAVPLDPFREAAESANGRTGAVAVARNWWADKGPVQVEQWAEKNGGVDFYGEGWEDSRVVDYDDLPEILARYKTFVHLPRVTEPFGRSVVEAWASGCELVVNRNVGSVHWISEESDKLETAAEDFWNLVLA